MPLQLLSSAAGGSGAQVSSIVPATQIRAPTLAHAPTPQLVATGTYPSSTAPLQLSSRPSQVASLAAGGNGTQLSLRTPPEHDVQPALAHAPTPQLVATATKP